MDTVTKKLIGTRINSALALRNIKQKELAKHLEVSDNTVSYFVGGSRAPNMEQLIKISNYLNVSTDYLLGLTDVASTDTKIKDICEHTGLSEEAVHILNISTYSRKNGCKTSTEYLKFLNAFLISNSRWECATSFLLESYKNALTEQTVCLKRFTEEYINNTNLSIIDIINKRADEVKQVEKETKFFKYEAIDAFEDFIENYLATELKAYNEAFETYTETIDRIYKSKTAKLFVEEENTTNANNNETE